MKGEPPFMALSEVIPGRLYVSAFARAPYREKTGKAVRRAADSLRAAGIGSIINCCGDSGRAMHPPHDFRYMHLRGLRDAPTAKSAARLTESLPSCIAFARASWLVAARGGGGGRLAVNGGAQRMGLLVHCREGKSRSASVAVAILCALDPALTVRDALLRVQDARPICQPNPSFMRALIAWRDEEGGDGCAAAVSAAVSANESIAALGT